MKLSWLLPGLLVGGGAAVGIVSDKVLGSESKVIVKGIPYQRQDKTPDGTSIQSPSANANAITIDLDALNVALPNRTKSQITAQAGEAPKPEQMHEEKLPIITLRTSNSAPPDTEEAPTRQAQSPTSSEYDTDLDEAASSASNGAAKAGNPASANRAIAGMGVGLVSVMLIFTIFL